MRRLGGLLAAGLALLALLPAAAPAKPAPAGSDDPLRTLGGDSPLCAHATTGQARANCQAAGAIEHPYPLDHYRFDWHIDTGITNIDGNIAAALQWIVSMLWQGVLWLANGILLAFQWAFSIDLLGGAMRPVRATLERLHTQVFGQPWFLAALSLLGLWGLWNGVLRRRTMATAGGLGAAVLMMAGALAIIAQPDATIGSATRAVNQTKLSILAGVTQGSVRNSQGALEDTSSEIFNTIVLRPWCAVEFGDVKWCLQRAPGSGPAITRAGRWLRFAPGSKARDAEYKLLADSDYNGLKALLDANDDDPDAPTKEQLASLMDPTYQKSITDTDRTKVKMQEQGRTIFRAGLVLLVIVGVAGWVALLGWLALQSLIQGLMALVLILAAPIMLLAPAFGEAGRRAFMKWATRLLATVVSGAIYALLLAITLTVATVIGELSVASTFLAAWFLQMLFLWGVFAKRKEALAWLGGVSSSNPMRFSELQAKKNLAKQFSQPVVSAVRAPIAAGSAAYGATGGAITRTHRDRAGDKQRAVQLLAAEQLAERGRQQLQTKYDAYHARLSTHDEAQRKLPEMRRRRDKLERELQSPKLSAERRAELEQHKGKLTGQIKSLEPKLMPRAKEGVARRFIESADRSLVESGRRFSDAQVAEAVEGLRRDVHGGSPASADEHAWRAQAYRPGIPEGELAKLPDEQRADLHQRIEDDLARDRELFAALPAHPRQERVPYLRRLKATEALKDDLGKTPVAAARREQRAQRLAQSDGGALHNVRAKRADRRARKSHQQVIEDAPQLAAAIVAQSARAARTSVPPPPAAQRSVAPPRHRDR